MNPMMRNSYNSSNVRESLLGSLNHHRRGQSLNGYGMASNNNNNNNEDNLDLFSRNRRTLSVTSSDDSSDVSVKLGRLSLGGAAPKPSRNGIDDLLSSTEVGKHDYDWLLTPPGTPVFPSSEGEPQPTTVPPRRSLTRSTSTTKASRLSVSQSENNNHSRPARSSSVTRPSVSNSHSQYSTYSSNRSTSILNTSSASVSSYIRPSSRPSSPVTRSSSAARPSTPSSRPAASSRPSTPSRVRSVSNNPTASSSSADRQRTSTQSSRPSTPSSRPHISTNLHSPSAPTPTRSLSRPSTPTRRNSMPSLSPSPSPTSSYLTSSSRVSLSGRNSAPSSRPSSPSPRVRQPPQPIVPPDFPLDTPPNLRTTLPDRPVSAGRSRPSSVTMKGNSSEPQASAPVSRRHSSPIVSRGRSTEPAARTRSYGSTNGHHADVPEPRKVQHPPEVVARRSVRASTTTATDNSGFGRTISKKSLDMAIKHMDIRNGAGNHRSLSNTTLFPQSIRPSSTPKSHRVSSALASVNMNGTTLHTNGVSNLDIGNDVNRIHMVRGREVDERLSSSKLSSEVDIYESSRYDALLLKEDLKNTNWLHSADDKCDQGPIFDNGFEHLPEPFGLL
ncbi:flocculation protein FLO11 [Arachis duranensis]|uniref:Flocculation protein FLO11 n=1 Tax=Arachis duranensis TaxID=130453 RepID=A0A6P4D4X2_ARADU|nr:flocculation protein FLO11 [Arachis duranensis]